MSAILEESEPASGQTGGIAGDARQRRRRSSREITLVLIGAASLASCGEPVQNQMAQRDVYEHRSQCVQDWGDEKKCEVVTQGPHRGYWYGPGYVGARYAPSSNTSSKRIGTTIEPSSGSKGSASGSHVSRSGFGSSASSRSSSSSS